MNTSKSQLEQFLVQNGFTKRGKTFLCRFHDDHKPSGSIYEKGGKWYFKCHSCGAQGDIYNLKDMLYKKACGTAYKEANGKKLSQSDSKSQKSTNTWTKPEKSPHKGGQEQKVYTLKEIENGGTIYYYYDTEGDKFDHIVKRWCRPGGLGKEFVQFHLDARGRWVGGGISPLRLYLGSKAHAERVKEAKVIVIVEGEKCVHTLHEIGVVATTKPCGAQAPEKADWTPVYGKEVILWPDNDEHGIKYMNQVKDLLSKHCKVKWIDPTKYDLKGKEDAADWVEKMKDYPAEVQQMPITEAMSCGASTELFTYLEDIALGKLKNINWGWPLLASYTQMFIPGTVTFLCGQGGDGKSLFSTQGMQYLHEDGIRWCMYELEDKRNFHLARALAQRIKNSTITSFDEMLGKIEYVKTLEKEHKDWADSFGRHIWTLPEEDVTLVSLAEWIRCRAKDGYRVIMVDPITAAEDGDLDKWKADKKFVKAAKKTAAEYKCSVLLITHPASGMYATPSLDGMQGGKALANLCHTAIWLKSADRKQMTDTVVDGRTVTGQLIDVGTPLGTLPNQVINRKMFLNKTRNGKKQGFEIGYWFDPASLTFKEVGMLL